MARKVSKNQRVNTKDVHVVKGPCSDCHDTEGPFSVTARYGSTGKRSVVRLCKKCHITA
jgi:hypothetical protein